MKIYKFNVLMLTLAVQMMPAWAQAGTCPEEAETCAHQMAEHFKKRGWVGINMNSDEETGRVTVTNVVQNSPAERAGLQEGDVLKALNGVAYTTENEAALKTEHESFRPGGTAVFTVDREGQVVDIEVHLEGIPDAILAQWIGQHVLEYHPAQADVETEEEAGGGGDR